MFYFSYNGGQVKRKRCLKGDNYWAASRLLFAPAM